MELDYCMWPTSNHCQEKVSIQSQSTYPSLATDASAYGVGAVISYSFPDGSEKLIAFVSCTLTSGEKNYPKLHANADALSRLPLSTNEKIESVCFDSIFNLGQLEALPLIATQLKIFDDVIISNGYC